MLEVDEGGAVLPQGLVGRAPAERLGAGHKVEEDDAEGEDVDRRGHGQRLARREQDFRRDDPMVPQCR